MEIRGFLYPFKRYSDNPILTKEDVPYPCNTVFNAAASKFNNGYLLILRIEDQRGMSHLTLARSHDGYKFKIDEEIWARPSKDPEFEPYERFGIEDPRITMIDGKYYITYTAFGPYGPRVGISSTDDFREFNRITLATEVENKDAVLFPEKINGNYVMINRPTGGGSGAGSIWITYSPDLVHWGRSKAIMTPEQGWGGAKLGISTPPVKTDCGWLALYHGVRVTASGRLYRIGALLLDLENPEKIIGYTPYFIFGPEYDYERIGDVPNVVFPCGMIVEDDGMVKMYYGAADTCIALAEGPLDELLRVCQNRPAS